MLEGANDLFFYLFLFLVVRVFIISPRGRFHQMFHAIFQEDVHITVLIDARHHPDSPVYPTTVAIVVDKDDLRLLLDRQAQLGGQGGLGEIAFDLSDRYELLAGKLRQFFLVDEIHLVATGGQRDIHLLVARFEIGETTSVQRA